MNQLRLSCPAWPMTPDLESSGAPYHTPVLAREIVEALQPAPGKLIVDGTLGGGGHTELFLRAGAQVIGMDQDDEALAFAKNRLEQFGEAFHPVKSNFRHIDRVLAELAVEKVDGVLLDIGVSSHQLDEAERGFSFQANGPLDMRMDRTQPRSAADIVNGADLEEMVRIFRVYGEAENAVRIARKLIVRRAVKPFVDTADLAAAVEEVSPRRGRKHPATQIFQALRIAVNDELGALADALEKVPALLNTGGRFGVITFHSLEDRMVKNNFRDHSQPVLDRPEWPAPRPNPDCFYRLVSRKGITASEEERTANPRARSATLRIVERT
ncbi:MAG TPA: 16S rRNA (cytosine(1402)-N(4))-methyltransferase RsmH [Chthoniobacterales bacterium]